MIEQQLEGARQPVTEEPAWFLPGVQMLLLGIVVILVGIAVGVSASHLTGAASDETSGYARGPSAAEPVDDAFIGRNCPRLASVARYFQQPEWDATFAFGLDALIAGFAVATEAPRQRAITLTHAPTRRRRNTGTDAS